MRRIARGLLLLFAFAIPWEYSLDLGEPAGNIARVIGVALLLVAILSILQTGRLRTAGAMQWAAVGFYLWFCCTYFWTIEPLATLDKLRGYFQEIMIVWLVWEFAATPRDLRWLLRAYVAGSWLLAALSLANFTSPEAIAAGQIRFVAEGQDPNDVARFLDLGFPLAALLFEGELHWPGRVLSLGYLPLGLLAVLLTASRGGFVAAVAALTGCAIVLARGHFKRVLAGVLALPAIGAVFWLIVPNDTFGRLATISEQLQGGSLNDRVNIWVSGWHAFAQAPFFGYGAGTFASAAGLAPINTAHNTALSILVNGGLIEFFLAFTLVAIAIWSIASLQGPVQWALGTALLVLIITSLDATVEENRTTWLLLALIAVAARLGREDAEGLASCFPSGARRVELMLASDPGI
jgi:O-antigen ligase